MVTMKNPLAKLVALSAPLLLASCIMPPARQGPAGHTAPATHSAPAAAPPAAGSPAPAPSPPSVVSVTLRNTCGSTVRIFFGDKPKFGSGTYSTLSSNTRTSKQFRPGDMMWIVDQSDNGLASVTITDRIREIEIISPCSEFRTR
jgi:hypothetical protein